MKIAQIAPFAESVPPRLYGGTETHRLLPDRGAGGQGHDVTLFASGDSATVGPAGQMRARRRSASTRRCAIRCRTTS